MNNGYAMASVHAMGATERARLRDRIARARIERARLSAQIRWDSERLNHSDRAVKLTQRQREVAALWADGYSLHEIAREFGLTSNGSVFDALRRTRKKLGLVNGHTARHRRAMRDALAEYKEKEAA